MITIQHRKEALSYAFMTALAAKAGVLLSIGNTFDYGIDGHMRLVSVYKNRRHNANGVSLEFQLKATTKWEVDPGDEHIIYDVEVSAYNDIAIRGPEEAGMVLIVLCLPKDEDEWVNVCADNLLLKHCCYWYKVKGGCLPKEEDQREKIYIPRVNLLEPETLTWLIDDERTRRLELMK